MSAAPAISIVEDLQAVRAELKFARCPALTHSPLPSQFYVDHSHCPMLAPATLAALPSTRAIPDRDVFYACHDVASAKVGRSSHSLHSRAGRLQQRVSQLDIQEPIEECPISLQGDS